MNQSNNSNPTSGTKNSQQNSIHTSQDPISNKVKEKIIEKMKTNPNPNFNNSNNSSIDNFKKRIDNLRTDTQENGVNNNTQKPNSSNLNNKNNNGYNTKITELENQIKDLNLELSQSKNQYLKALADGQNMQKQHDIDIASAKKSARKSIATTLSTFVNTFNLSFSYIPEIKDEKVEKFINTLKDSFEKSVKDLEIHNIQFLIPKFDDVFDPNFMEILNSDSITDQENIKVKQVISVGIKVDGQIIQPSSIMI